MKRKAYQTPAMKVVKMQSSVILTGSVRTAKGQDFTWDVDDDNGE